MLDIRVIRENKEAVRQNLSRRHVPDYLQRLDDVVNMDVAYREALQQVESLRAKRNQITQSVAQSLNDPAEKQRLIQESKNVGEEIKQNETVQNDLKQKIRDALLRLPNVLDESVPFGKDDSENVEVSRWGDTEKKPFETIPHAEIALKIEGVEFERAAKISGSGFYFLKGELLKLEMAIQRFALHVLEEEDFTRVQPPFLMNRAAYEGVTDLSEFDNQLYKIEGEDLHLIATSEHPLTAQFMNEHLPVKDLPICFAGISTNFR
ncbi:MAG: serine--tRNA ligase, partial [archaeon]